VSFTIVAIKIPSQHNLPFSIYTCAENPPRRDLHVSCNGNFLAAVADSAATPSQSNAAAGALSLSETADANLLSSQRAPRKRDRWSGLVVMGEFCV
jgi:hypothetical protein